MKKKVLYALAKMKMLKGLVEKAGKIGDKFTDLEKTFSEGILGKELLKKLDSIEKDLKWMLNHNESDSEIVSVKTGEKIKFHIETISDSDILEMIKAIKAFKIALFVFADNEEILYDVIENFLDDSSDIYEDITEELSDLSKECFEIIEKGKHLL